MFRLISRNSSFKRDALEFPTMEQRQFGKLGWHKATDGIVPNDCMFPKALTFSSASVA